MNKKNKVYVETDPSIFQQLVGYLVGDVESEDCSTTVRFDKQVENVIISRELLFDDEGIHETEDYILDIIPKTE
jgi:hypothetical protein